MPTLKDLILTAIRTKKSNVKYFGMDSLTLIITLHMIYLMSPKTYANFPYLTFLPYNTNTTTNNN